MVNGGLNIIWHRQCFFILSGIEHIIAYVLTGYGITELPQDVSVVIGHKRLKSAPTCNQCDPGPVVCCV